MFVLQLNPILINYDVPISAARGEAEILVPVARAETREALLDFIKRETVTPYTTDNRWHKCFRQGGPLEWFKDPGPQLESLTGVPVIIDVGTREDWCIRAGRQYDHLYGRLLGV